MPESKLFTVTRHITFDTGHRVPNHRSKCRNVHGHTWKLEVSMQGPLILEGTQNPEEGMVIDFGDLKKVMMEEVHDRFDHKMLLWEEDPLVDLLEKGFDYIGVAPSNSEKEQELYDCGLGLIHNLQHFGIVQELKHVPTAENLAYICYKLVSKRIDDDIAKVVSVRLWETPNNVTEYRP